MKWTKNIHILLHSTNYIWNKNIQILIQESKDFLLKIEQLEKLFTVEEINTIFSYKIFISLIQSIKKYISSGQKNGRFLTQ